MKDFLTTLYLATPIWLIAFFLHKLGVPFVGWVAGYLIIVLGIACFLIKKKG